MAAPFGSFTLQAIEGNVQGVLTQLRDALYRAEQLQAWLSAHTQADFTAAPLNMPTADAAAMFTAVADANALAVLATTGLPPSTYPQPASSYAYLASINQVIGPLP